MATDAPEGSPSSSHLLPPRSESSPELGSPSKVTQYNKRTGRPVRHSAGKMQRVAGYVDPQVLDEEDFVPTTTEGESDDNESSSPRGRANKTRRKRKRSPSPPSPHLGPIDYHPQLDELTDDETSAAVRRRRTPKQQSVTLRFDVPLGYHGPLLVKLDPTMLKLQDDTSRSMRQSKKHRFEHTQAAVVNDGRKGFTDLPPELRNKIYRLVFVREKPLQIPACKPWGQASLCQSGQFLSTCKLVHNEGCSILYGENVFAFERHESTRATFYEYVVKEIGYQDALRFLKMIGPENLQYLRDVKICFTDARPTNAPLLSSKEERRYMTDTVLINFLRILRNAKLRTLRLAFNGRRNLQSTDDRFLRYLEQIKVDELEQWTTQSGYPNWDKIRGSVWTDLKSEMVRKKKLYEPKILQKQVSFTSFDWPETSDGEEGF
ncbi:hypothetical protein E8E13_005224 [Curvularia kusanoi]|uniref:Uncharacterized protein n=1 Tax=Curvularia kusanoi TaxID=90978 RepID=A0A9P4TPJ3_CURKU|nr:hypothetical protein E8E13_005224 [Curvularia kusanoi]